LSVQQQRSESVDALGIVALHSVREVPWGQRTLRLLDPDGNLIEWGESVACFVRRLHRTCGSDQDVAETTGVGIDEVRRILDKGTP
jgi:hypothetical protein